MERKFNRFLPIKLICVFLSLIISGYAVVEAFNIASETAENYGMESVIDASFGSLSNTEPESMGPNFETSLMFDRAYDQYLDALYTIIPMGDGSKDAYKTYCKAYNKNYVEMNKKVAEKKNIDRIKSEANYTILKNLLADDNATLEKIAKHSDYLKVIYPDGDASVCYYVFIENTPFYIDNNGNLFDSNGSYYGFGDIEVSEGKNVEVYRYGFLADDGDTYTTTQENISSDEKSTSKKAWNYVDEKATIAYSSATIPESVTEKAGNGAVVLELCNFVYNGKLYDGYYSLSLDDNYILMNCDRNSYFADKKYETYNDFSYAYKNTKNIIEDFGNFSYLVWNNNTETVERTNVEDLKNSSLSNIENRFSSQSWACVRDTKEGIINRSVDYFSYSSDDRISFLKSSEDFTIYISLDENLPLSDRISELKDSYNKCLSDFKVWIIKALICFAAVLLLIIILIVFDGRRSYDRKIHMLKMDKIFTVIRTSLNFGLISAVMYFAVRIIRSYGYNGIHLLPTVIIASCVCTLLFEDWLLFIVRHIKNRSFWRSFLLGYIIVKIRRHIEKVKNEPPVYKDLFREIKKRVVPFCIIEGVLLIISAGFFFERRVVFAMTFGIASLAALAFGVALVLRYGFAMKKIMHVVNEMRGGNYNIIAEEAGIPKSLKPYAENVNEVSLGLKNAVEQAVRDQNTKTELITNISHDLKTPLTSIINYVDLLSKTDITDEKALSYLSILNEKSSKLKRLIEDLVEASKATTGNIKVESVVMCFNELVNQVEGEYADEMQSNNLSLVGEIPEENLYIMADSKMIFRVLDNLLNNARKYSLPGSRVYFKLEKVGDNAVFSLKNISASPLNISPDELKKRFVRGDISRTTDGSGLGLSIAESFCKLMGAELELEIDGDMFTAKVIFKTVEEI